MAAGLNILSISGDASLGLPAAGAQTGNTVWRQRHYASRVNHLTVIVAASGDSDSSGMVEEDRLTIIRICRRTRWLAARAALARALDVCRTAEVHCVATQDPFLTGWVGWRVKQRAGIPLNLHLPADMLFNPYFLREHPRNRVKAWLGRRLLAQADTIRVSTRQESERLRKQGVAEERIWVVPFLVDVEQALDDGGLTPALGRPLVGFAGRLARQKDAAVFLESAAAVSRRLPACQFALLGDGPEREALQRLASRLGIAAQTHFLGNRPYRQARAFLSRCDVIVSSARYEGTCMVLLEAAAARRPIVATRTAGALDAVIDGETGFHVGIGDATGVADKVVYVLTHPEHARRMGEAGRAHVTAAFDVERHLKQYAAMWEATCAAARGTSSPARTVPARSATHRDKT